MRNILLVAKREYLEQIRGRAFRLTTILVPAAFALIMGIGYLSSIGLGSPLQPTTHCWPMTFAARC